MNGYNCGICKKGFQWHGNPIFMYLDGGVDVVGFSEQTCDNCMTLVADAINKAIEEVKAHVENR